MNMLRWSTPLVLCALWSCGPGADGLVLGHRDGTPAATALSVDHEARLSFRADHNHLLDDGPIVAGGRLKVLYAPERLLECRGEEGGALGWEIALHARFDRDADEQVMAMGREGQLFALLLEVPDSATQVELWFENRDDSGCQAWDGDADDPYRFQVSPPQTATPIAFGRDWSEEVGGVLRQGGLIRIDFEPQRLPLCRATYAGGRAWNIIASWRFLPGGESGDVALFQGEFYSGEAALLHPAVDIPAGASAVEMWFSNSDRTGCVSWDSNLGANYRFDILPAEGSPAVGWIGDHDFVLVQGYDVDHQGDRDPAYYFDRMAGSRGNSWLEVQVWIPGVSDSLDSPPDYLVAQAVTDALPLGPELPYDPETTGAVNLSFVRRQGNNFVYAFHFSRLHINTFYNPPLPDGLYRYFYRFSTDGGVTFSADSDLDQSRRFVVAADRDCGLFPDHAPSGCPIAREVGWAGSWGGRFDHSCQQVDALPNPVVFTKSALGHDCMVISAEVYVPGVTDSYGDPSAILAQVETDIGFSGGPLPELVVEPLVFDSRVGNNFRYQWQLQEHVGRADRGDYRYRFRFSADAGQTWTTLGSGEGDVRTLLVRNDSLDIDGVQYCDDIERWSSPFQHQAECIDYQPDLHSNVQQEGGGGCAFFVNALGRGSWSHNQTHARWLEAYLSIGAHEGELLEAGMLTRLTAADGGEIVERWSLGYPLEDGYWRTGVTYEENSEYSLQVVDFAFFIDVRLYNGTVQRMWLSNQGTNYTLDSVFAVEGFHNNIGSGSVEYASETDPAISLFDQRRLCQ